MWAKRRSEPWWHGLCTFRGSPTAPACLEWLPLLVQLPPLLSRIPRVVPGRLPNPVQLQAGCVEFESLLMFVLVPPPRHQELLGAPNLQSTAPCLPSVRFAAEKTMLLLVLR